MYGIRAPNTCRARHYHLGEGQGQAVGLCLACESARDDPISHNDDPVVDRMEQVSFLLLDIGGLPRLRLRAEPLDGPRRWPSGGPDQPFTYERFSAIFPSWIRKTSTPRTCPGDPSFDTQS